jgi:hypothetical protein
MAALAFIIDGDSILRDSFNIVLIGSLLFIFTVVFLKHPSRVLLDGVDILG